MTELRLALRRLRHRPARGLAIALTLGIGLGATTAAFTAVDAVLLQDLPVEDQDELVVIWRLNPERGAIPIPFRAPAYDAVVRGAESLSEAAGVSAWGSLPVPVGDGGGVQVLDQARIAGDFFGVLGVTPAAGRLLDHADDRPGAEPVAVLSHSAWRNRYAFDPGVVGRALSVDGAPVTVVGVAPEGFDFPHGTDLWTPLRHDFAGDPGFVELHVVGRRAPGVDPSTVGSDVAAALTSAPTISDGAGEWLPVVRGLDEHLRGAVRPLVRAGLAAAALLLLAAATNGTLLLLAGGRVAARDLAIRRALGADRARVLSRWVADAAVVGMGGILLGLLIAWTAVRLLVPLVPPELPRLDLIVLDGRAAAFAAALGLAVTLMTAGCAALATSRRKPADLLSAGARASSRSGGARRSVAALQVGLTVVSAIGAGLLMRTVWAMDRLDVGMADDEITAVTLRVPYTWFEVPESYFAALEAVTTELESRPGVFAARPSLGPPLQQRLEVVLVAEGQDPDAAEENPYVAIDAVLPDHFRAMGIPLLAGRGIVPSDNRPDAEPVVVVDEVLADALWRGEDPVGRRLSGFGPVAEWHEVVGVVGATRYREYLRPHPRAYFPLRRLGNAPPTALLVRHDPTTPPPVERLVREAFDRADPSVQVLAARRLSDAVRAPTMDRRFAAGILTAFAGATIVLALLGVYGVFTVSVQERIREMGVRRALGARRSSIATLVLMGIVRVAAVGAGLGLVASVWAGRLVESLLFSVEPLDPPTFLAVAVGSIVAAAMAGLLPALRASATDPVVSLRSE